MFSHDDDDVASHTSTQFSPPLNRGGSDGGDAKVNIDRALCERKTGDDDGGGDCLIVFVVVVVVVVVAAAAAAAAAAVVARLFISLTPLSVFIRLSDFGNWANKGESS